MYRRLATSAPFAYGTQRARGSAHFIFITHFGEDAAGCSGGCECCHGAVTDNTSFPAVWEVFADARLTACIALAPRMDRAWVKTFSSSSSSLRSQSSALIRALASAFLPLLHVPGTAGAVLQKMTKR